MAPKKKKKTKAVADINGWPVVFAPLKEPVPEGGISGAYSK